MSIWPIIQPLFIIGVAVFLIMQFIYPVWVNKPVFPAFRRKKKVVLKIQEKKEEMSAEKALDLVNDHCQKALHFIAVAESYAENEKTHAKEKLEKALSTMNTVKERAQKIKDLNPKKDEV